MKLALNKTRLISILFAVALILIAALVVANKLLRTNSNEDQVEVNSSYINEKFINVLSDFAIKEEWIKKSRNNKDSTTFSYLVEIPADLPVVSILNDLYNVYDPEEAVLSASEKKIGKETIVEIYSNFKLKLKAEFRYNNKLFRKAANIGIVLESLTNLNQELKSRILNTPEAFAVLLIPSTQAKEIADSISRNRKEYIVLLNDEITEINFKLNPAYSENRLNISLREIIGSFSNAVIFLVDENSNLYSSGIYSFIKNEIEKRNIIIREKSSFNSLADLKENKQTSFKDEILNDESGGNKIIIIDSSDFLDLLDTISALRKKGYRFVNPSEIIFNY